MPEATFVVPGPIDTRTGGYIYDRRIVAGLRRRGWRITVLAAPSDLRSIADGELAVVDGLTLATRADMVASESRRLRIVPVVHLPLAADVTLAPDETQRLEAIERRAFATATRVIVTSEATRPLLARYDLPSDSIAVVEPGTDPAPIARGSNDASVHLLCVANVHAGKGHDVLLRALAHLREDQWDLTCAGDITRDPLFVEELHRLSRMLGISARVTFSGELDDAALATAYDGADAFVLATLQETYGMAVADALARGLPVVSTRTGAIPALVGDDAGLLAAAGDVEALAHALARVIRDRELRGQLAAGARRVRDRLPTWNDAAARFEQQLSQS